MLMVPIFDQIEGSYISCLFVQPLWIGQDSINGYLGISDCSHRIGWMDLAQERQAIVCASEDEIIEPFKEERCGCFVLCPERF
jgi:hypothetical protein